MLGRSKLLLFVHIEMGPHLELLDINGRNTAFLQNVHGRKTRIELFCFRALFNLQVPTIELSEKTGLKLRRCIHPREPAPVALLTLCLEFSSAASL